MTDSDIESQRKDWVAKLQALLETLPEGLQTQLVTYNGIQIGIRRMDDKL